MNVIILECITVLIMAIVTYYVVPFLKDKKLYQYVCIAVKAAEQIYNETGMGKQKFNYVKEWIKSKFKVSDKGLKNIIESAVYEMNLEKGGECNGS